uniref:Uncharacterized protein n=1 Tax=Meloidogyne enterolobii TaxID=390850 RepID=A0A6V7W4G1_MELEN|nr:unnamed protein product [Meloidogyne enterolobii]
MITNLQKHTNGDNKEDKIRNHLHAKYVEAKRKNQRIKASAAADEVNYEFDLNVISERMAERCFNIFNKETTNIDLCQVDSKNKGTKVDKNGRFLNIYFFK